MKILSFFILIVLLTNCRNKVADNHQLQPSPKHLEKDSLIAYNYVNEIVKVPLNEELKKNLQDTTKECLNDYTVSAVNAPIKLPNPGRIVLLHDITNSNAFTVACESCGLGACVAEKWNPRYFNPKDNMLVWYGSCFSISIGNIRACQTANGWRVEGDKDGDGNYEGILKIILQ